MNRFDPSTFPDMPPAYLVAGDYWAWRAKSITSSYGTADYNLIFRLSLLADESPSVEIACTSDGGGFLAQYGSSDTKTLEPGDYYWQAVVVRVADGEEVTADAGMLVVRPGIGAAGDMRSHAYRVLMAIRACILGTADKDQQSYTIAGRSLSRRSPEELVKLENVYAKLVEKEKAGLDAESGRPVSKRVLAKMSA